MDEDESSGAARLREESVADMIERIQREQDAKEAAKQARLEREREAAAKAAAEVRGWECWSGVDGECGWGGAGDAVVEWGCGWGAAGKDVSGMRGAWWLQQSQ